MSSTQSSEAKSRSQSAPKQRPEQQPRKRVPLSEVVLEACARLGGVGMAHKPCNNRAAAQEAFDFRAAVVSRFERPPDAAAAAERERDAFFLQRRW